jgi:hypothetical protein
MKWLEHVACMLYNKFVHSFDRTSERKKVCGRSRRRWTNNIKCDVWMIVLKDVFGTDLSQDRYPVENCCKSDVY